jgi:biofilm PGA synthesis protein PgaA
MANALLDLREYRQAEQKIDELGRLYPNDPHVQKLQRLKEIHNMRELRLEAGYGDSDGSAEGDRDFFFETVLFSRPFHENFRTFAGYRHGFASFPEGDKNFDRYGAGFEYRGPDLTGLAEITWNVANGGDPGFRLAAEWELNDYWSFPIELELFSRETPLRALKNGVEADAAAIGFRYRKSERRQLNLLTRFMDFSDGNFRSEVFTRFSQRLLTYPKYKLTAHMEVDGSTNSKDDTVYYNPEQDLTVNLILDNLWRVWRRYDRSFSHRLTLSAGNYWQKDFGSDFIANACYEHIHEACYRLDWVYGACYGRNVYDGDTENRAYFYSRLGWKF